jgi:DNA-binding MurR/RpiR family transcriptional regulator
MAKVVQLQGFRSKDTIGELRELLVMASKGKVSGLVFSVEMTDGSQRVGFTGKFRSNAAEAVKMAHHLSVLLNNITAHDDEATPSVQRDSGAVVALPCSRSARCKGRSSL